MDFLLNKTISTIHCNFENKELIILFSDKSKLELKECLYYNDLGIINKEINFVSEEGTMGFIILCKQMYKSYDDYKYLLLSHDINNFLNKKEISIAYKNSLFKEFDNGRN